MKKASITVLSPEGVEITLREAAERTGLTASAAYARYRKGQDVFAPHTGRGRRSRKARASLVERAAGDLAEGVTTAILCAVAVDRGSL